jgi:hypothetical protein
MSVAVVGAQPRRAWLTRTEGSGSPDADGRVDRVSVGRDLTECESQGEPRHCLVARMDLLRDHKAIGAALDLGPSLGTFEDIAPRTCESR